MDQIMISPPSPAEGQWVGMSDAGLKSRFTRLMNEQIDFIPNPLFEHEESDDLIKSEWQAVSELTSRDGHVPQDLPGHLARLCEAKLLTPEEETRLFRRMNYVKYRAHQVRLTLNENAINEEQLTELEDFLAEARAIRDRIVQGNMRLVMAVVKKFVTPQHSFDDMLSDGIYSLMQAAEKFDFDRGFRFSTYAYRAIVRNSYRTINDRQREALKFATAAEAPAFDVLDERGSSSVYDAAWDRLRNLLAQFMDRLDRRERFIIRSRYALGSHRRVRTFQCLADKLGVSKERVRQLEQRAVAKLQACASEQKLDEIVGTFA